MGLFACPRVRCLLCLLLLASLPATAYGFALIHGRITESCRTHGAALISGDRHTRPATCLARRAGRGSLVCMSLGRRDGGGNEHKDYKDQREETEDNSSSRDDDLHHATSSPCATVSAAHPERPCSCLDEFYCNRCGCPRGAQMVGVKERDWRLFRKNLISQYGEDSAKAGWQDGYWAHEIGRVEPGCLLLASEEIWDGPFHQSVILVLSHHQDLGTVGLILNRPGPQRLHSLAGLKSDLAEVFADSQVFDGGPVGLGTMTVVHAAERAEGSETVLPGVYAGGFDSLVRLTRKGTVAKDRVRFVHGHSAWAPGQLQRELDRNQWFVAAAAPELVTADCDKPSNPLWGKVLRLMGGRYQEVAKRNEPTT